MEHEIGKAAEFVISGHWMGHIIKFSIGGVGYEIGLKLFERFTH